jgi:general secretion pathway protein I
MSVPPRYRAGFTLLEVLVAVAILAVALVAILASCLSLEDGLLRSRDIAATAELANAKLAEVERVGADNWREDDGDFSPEFPRYKWHVDLHRGLIGGLALVTVTVSSEGKAWATTRFDKLLLP